VSQIRESLRHVRAAAQHPQPREEATAREETAFVVHGQQQGSKMKNINQTIGSLPAERRIKVTTREQKLIDEGTSRLASLAPQNDDG
jgi:hypothetical protein